MFIDLQVNGHSGIDFLNATTPDQIRFANRALKKEGVAGFLASLITSDLSQLQKAAKLVNEVAATQSEDEAKILGIHIEGPCLSHERRGVHAPNLLQNPEPEFIKELIKIPNLKMITMAPELPGAIDAIKEISANNIVVSLGHTTAERDIAQAAFDAGAKTVTHLYNGMKKDGGLVDLVLERDDVLFQMIIDDVHVSRDLVKRACDKAIDRLIVTTDSVSAAGLGQGRHRLGDMEIEIRNGRAERLDGTLAGGIGTLAKSLEILEEMGYAREKILPAVTTRPLKLINAHL
ncbi:MAG: N-acetylglucosamine-6-phosphate deacetylase [Actinomycetales bacterium]